MTFALPPKDRCAMRRTYGGKGIAPLVWPGRMAGRKESDMPCPICDQKPMNCDCTPEERRLYSETQDLEAEVERLTKENGLLRGLCGLSPKQPIPELR